MISSSLRFQPKQERVRVAVFVMHSNGGFLRPQVLPYLSGLKPLTKAVVVVCADDLARGEREKLLPYTVHVITGHHDEGFSAYKCGITWADRNGLLNDADDLVLCDDSCFGPVGSFMPMFAAMDEHQLDLWGATDSHEVAYHLQSYWLVLSRNAFSSDAFTRFMEGVKQQHGEEDARYYELSFTNSLTNAGFKAGAMVSNILAGSHPEDPSYHDLTQLPLYTLEKGLPLIRVKAFYAANANMDGQNRLLSWLRENAPAVYKNVISDINIRRFEDADEVAFSLILPTRNRAWCISRAITSVMAQTHQKFELIIVDDGSTDSTEELVSREFGNDILTGRIKYIRLPKNVGVSNARNIGISFSENKWITYVDSDNELRPYYLSMVANAIVSNPEKESFYGKIISKNNGRIIGVPFIRPRLLEGNFIDLGVFTHKRSLVSKFGGFDPDLKRLVDWDLIIRLTEKNDPIFIPHIFLEYYDQENDDRISVKESFIGAKLAIHTKNSVKLTVSTAIISYNHEEFIVEAIESALAQTGNFSHEVMISDDGSTDGTVQIIERYAQKYPGKVRNITRGPNFGISENYKHCFRQASGRFVAILEGDDYWIDDRKNLKQAQFLADNPEAAMVFSMIELFDTQKNTHRLLDRQKGLRALLTGEDFANDDHLNLIVNLSSSMYVRDIVSGMPSHVFTPRISEITIPFYLDRIGKKIGFIEEVMGVWRMNPFSTWTGASPISKLEQALAVRENTWRIAKDIYKPKILEHIKKHKKQLKIRRDDLEEKDKAA